MTEGYFDIERDNQYPCFCQACGVGKTEAEMSEKDIRYCIECQQVIEREYLMSGNKYIPVKLSNQNPAPLALKDKEIPTEKLETKMSTLNQESLEVDKFRPRTRKSTYKKRELPIAQIEEYNKQGMGAKAIATRLKGQGIQVSYKTIQRVLSGERT